MFFYFLIDFRGFSIFSMSNTEKHTKNKNKKKTLFLAEIVVFLCFFRVFFNDFQGFSIYFRCKTEKNTQKKTQKTNTKKNTQEKTLFVAEIVFFFLCVCVCVFLCVFYFFNDFRGFSIFSMSNTEKHTKNTTQHCFGHFFLCVCFLYVFLVLCLVFFFFLCF